MDLKGRLKEKALELGFSDIGFTNTEPFGLFIQEINSRPPEMYGWLKSVAEPIDLKKGAQIEGKYPWAHSLAVLIQNYHKYKFPQELTGKIGRFYQVDDRMEKKDDYERMRAYFSFLKDEGIRARADFEISARMAAARAGIATYGKNCFAYAKRILRGTSWVVIIPIALDAVIEPDESSIEFGCPSWCRNTCIAACPTKALYAPGKMNPLRCIAYNSYYRDGITPMDLREPMGIWVYGCDRCQQVCPRNESYMSQELPINKPLEDRAGDFRPDTLLTMTDEHYINKVWPLCFYISRKNKAKWQMNAARALGNLKDPQFIPVLSKSLSENTSEEVRGMCAWALGRLGGSQAKPALESRLNKESGLVRQEIELALASIKI